MRPIPTAELGRYLLHGQLCRQGCVAYRKTIPAIQNPPSRPRQPRHGCLVRSLHTAPTPDARAAQAPPTAAAVPLRKRLKDEARQLKKEARATGRGGKGGGKGGSQTVDGWELTVGIEIHAQLNTARKLFSPAATSFNDEPNSHVALFDVAMPGSQPLFQKETLIPALRAALALDCEIRPVSRFDRKHYFWWDQPSGYQITQYYEPFARNGRITLTARDGIAPEDGEGVTVGIQQVQLEQDTAKTLAQPGDASWLDFNRVGAPLIEIITRPDMHHPRTAAAFVRKVQVLLGAVDACVSGMETGGLRADVNVSVRRSGDPSLPLGTRTEIKNLGTIKAVEDAIIAERDRQIREIEAGRPVAGETRGWTLGSRETRRLRGKEGEVDYRYMPDPDLGPLVIADDLVRHLRDSVAYLPDDELDELVRDYGLTAKDAASLLSLDGGARIEYFYNVVGSLGLRLRAERDGPGPVPDLRDYAPLAANWILHELGRLADVADGGGGGGEPPFALTPDGDCARLPVVSLSELLHHLYRKRVTGKVAKELLTALYAGSLADSESVTAAIDAHDLWFRELSAGEYAGLAREALDGEDRVLAEFRAARAKAAYPQGKLMYLVGKMIRMGPTERIDPASAERAMRAAVEEACAGRE